MAITDRELRAIREEQQKFMPQRVLIRKNVNIGGGQRAPKTLASDVPARFKAGPGRFRIEADRMNIITPLVLSVPYGTDLKPGYEVVDENATVFYVRDVRTPSSLETAIQSLVEQVTD